MLAPFIFLKEILGGGKSEAIYAELILTWATIGGIFIDWSSTNLLGRNQKRLLKCGAYQNIVLGKVCSALLISCVVWLFLTYFFPKYSILRFSFLTICLGDAFDPSWVYFGRKQIWVPQAMGIFRYFVAYILVLFGFHSSVGLSSGFFATNILFTFPFIRDIRFHNRVSLSFYKLIVKRYFSLGVNDLLTSTFSMFDVTIAVFAFGADAALSYVISRKIVLGFLGIAFASVPLLYIERDNVEMKLHESSLKFLVYFVSFTGGIFSYFVMHYYYRVDFNLSSFLTLAFLLLLLPVGYLKNKFQFGYLFKNGLFRANLFSTIVACLFFAIVSFSIVEFHLGSIWCFSALRVLVDCVFLAFAWYFVEVK
jgi:hypothetical protein